MEMQKTTQWKTEGKMLGSNEKSLNHNVLMTENECINPHNTEFP